jgi:hypothetical protein
MRQPINVFAHSMLTDQGAAVLDHQGEADFDDGDAENGPGTWGHPEYDCYQSDGMMLCLDWRGISTSEFERDPPDYTDDRMSPSEEKAWIEGVESVTLFATKTNPYIRGMSEHTFWEQGREQADDDFFHGQRHRR